MGSGGGDGVGSSPERLVLVPPDDMRPKVLLQTLQGVAHAFQLTANLSEAVAQPRLSVAQLGDLGTEAVAQPGLSVA